jgi:hypothetical protein
MRFRARIALKRFPSRIFSPLLAFPSMLTRTQPRLLSIPVQLHIGSAPLHGSGATPMDGVGREIPFAPRVTGRTWRGADGNPRPTSQSEAVLECLWRGPCP